MERPKISHSSTVVLPYNETNPCQLLIQVKDDGLPNEYWRRCLCLIGGNWRGEEARNDANPKDTATRELHEEFSLKNRRHPPLTLHDLKRAPEGALQSNQDTSTSVEKTDERRLTMLVDNMVSNLHAAGDCLIEVFDKWILTSYFLSPVSVTDWKGWTYLYQKYGNLSQEGFAIPVSAQDILETGTRTAWGHDYFLRGFLRQHGCIPDGHELPMEDGIQHTNCTPLGSYVEYMGRYNITITP